MSEMIAATANGRTLVYTDAVRGTIPGFIDITNPSNPQPLGILPLDPDSGRRYRPQSDISRRVGQPLRAGRGGHHQRSRSTHRSGYLLVVDIDYPAVPFVAGVLD